MLLRFVKPFHDKYFFLVLVSEGSYLKEFCLSVVSVCTIVISFKSLSFDTTMKILEYGHVSNNWNIFPKKRITLLYRTQLQGDE